MAEVSRRDFLTRLAGVAGVAGALAGCTPTGCSSASTDKDGSKPWDLCWSRLPLEGTVNTRELGGYPTKDGVQTAYHTFLRSDELSYLTEEDTDFLLNYGVSLIVDLRAESYFVNYPDRAVGNVPVVNVPIYELVTEEDNNRYNELVSAGEYYIERVYDFVIENETRMRECFEAIAAAEGCVLFHCQIGKDRTGIVAALLMQLAGCDDYDIISNYMVSRVNLTRDASYLATWNSELAPATRSQYESAVESGEYILQLLAERGGARQYLLDCGVSAAALDGIASRFVQA